jgi:hypothetical protein
MPAAGVEELGLEPLALGTAIVAARMKTASRRRVDGAGDIALQDAAFLLQARVRDRDRQ